MRLVSRAGRREARVTVQRRRRADAAVVPTLNALVNVVAGVLAPVALAAAPLARPGMLLGVGRAERARLAALGVADVPEPDAASREDRRTVRADAERRVRSWLVTRALVGLAAGLLVLFAWSAGLALTAFPLYAAERTPPRTATCLAAGAVCLVLAWWSARALARWDARTAHRLLSPDAPNPLAARVADLIRSRASVVEAVDAERRRIERDLHDGVQQQLVALALLLAGARRAASGDAPAAASRLPATLERAHENALQALAELRDVAWRIYPAILDDRGLDPALSALAERSAVPVRVDCELSVRLPRGIEPVAYFAVSEAVTNAAKHAEASVIDVRIREAGEKKVRITVTDDGVGGADVTGAGLSGLLRRVTAVEGEMTVTSPVGGPTVVTVELPCVS